MFASDDDEICEKFAFTFFCQSHKKTHTCEHTMFVLDTTSLIAMVLVAVLVLFLVATFAHSWCGSRVYASLVSSFCDPAQGPAVPAAAVYPKAHDYLLGLTREGVVWSDRCRRELMLWAAVLGGLGVVMFVYGTYYKRA